MRTVGHSQAQSPCNPWGVDCLQATEVKVDHDTLKWFIDYGLTVVARRGDLMA